MAVAETAPRQFSPPARADPVALFAVGIGLLLAFLALYPTFMLFYGSVSSAPLGLPGTFTLEHYRTAAESAHRPFIYLSAGVSNEQFTESLQWAAEAGVHFSGVLCGRATWKDGIPVYAKEGLPALEKWLSGEGVTNIQAVNECLKAARPWYSFYGAKAPTDLAA